ncbi:hypothetical protein F5X96DRAFT_616138 [Biscogniauxia mediterranea]|nr:hypothetical protein F5X96DRAFT_616138 [Biscogniauxia mediterranea]
MYNAPLVETLHSVHIRTTAGTINMVNPNDKSGSKSKSPSIWNRLARRNSSLAAPDQDAESSLSSLSGSFSRLSLTRSRKSKADEAGAETETGTRSNNPFNDPPPSYSATTSASYNQTSIAHDDKESRLEPSADSGAYPSSSSYRPGAYTGICLANASTDDDPYAFLSLIDTVFLIDDSGSMSGERWRQTEQALNAILPICVDHDQDGIDLYFLNHLSRDPGDPRAGAAGTGYRNVTDVSRVQRIFRTVRPTGTTPTGPRLRDILTPYTRHYAARVRATGDETCVKPLNVIVITDGKPTHDPESILVETAKLLDRLNAPLYQVGVQFFQVGDDPDAARALQELDDELATQNRNQGMRDIVDTATFEFDPKNRRPPVLSGEGILKVVLGSVVKRLDRKPTR